MKKLLNYIFKFLKGIIYFFRVLWEIIFKILSEIALFKFYSIKKIVFIFFLITNSFMLSAQLSSIKKIKTKPSSTTVTNTNNAQCTNFLKIVELANSKQLKNLTTNNFKSKYFKQFGSYTMSASSTNIEDGLENFIVQSVDGVIYYTCFFKDYAMDSSAAKADFKSVKHTFEGCLKTKKIISIDPLSTLIKYKKCEINISTYLNGNSSTWVTDITIRNQDY